MNGVALCGDPRVPICRLGLQHWRGCPPRPCRRPGHATHWIAVWLGSRRRAPSRRFRAHASPLPARCMVVEQRFAFGEGRLRPAPAPASRFSNGRSYSPGRGLLLTHLPHRLRQRAALRLSPTSAIDGSERTSTWPALTSCVSSASTAMNGAGKSAPRSPLYCRSHRHRRSARASTAPAPSTPPTAAQHDEYHRDEIKYSAAFAVAGGGRRRCVFYVCIHGVIVEAVVWEFATSCGLS